jgi:hypothetical protein
MCIVCKHPGRDDYAGADPASVAYQFLTLEITAREQRENYETVKHRIERNESQMLCAKHLENYRLVVEALEAHHAKKWGKNDIAN